jgi:hypothetical protein
VADKVDAAYRRTDLFERRRREWARYCGKTPVASESPAIVAMRR